MPEADNGTAEGRAIMKKYIEREASKYGNIHVVDLMQVFCQDKTCRMTQNGKMLYGDSQHLNRSGAAVAAPLVFKSFGE